MGIPSNSKGMCPIKNKPGPVIIGPVNLLTTMQKVTVRKRNSRAMLKSSKKK